MSTFVCTSSHSHLAESLDDYLTRECKPGIMVTKEQTSMRASLQQSALQPCSDNKCLNYYGNDYLSIIRVTSFYYEDLTNVGVVMATTTNISVAMATITRTSSEY